MAKGNFIEYVVSDNPNKYPNGGEQSGYYYELDGAPETVTLISFTISSISFQAEEGMTWAEWVASSYNKNGYAISSDGKVVNRTGRSYIVDDEVAVTPDDIIKPNYEYSTVTPSGGSN